MKCCVCETERENFVTIKTTPADREAITKLGQIPKDEYVYCKPCANLLRDKEKGASLIRGIMATRLRLRGNAQAEAIAQRLYDFLIQKGHSVS